MTKLNYAIGKEYLWGKLNNLSYAEDTTLLPDFEGKLQMLQDTLVDEMVVRVDTMEQLF